MDWHVSALSLLALKAIEPVKRPARRFSHEAPARILRSRDICYFKKVVNIDGNEKNLM